MTNHLDPPLVPRRGRNLHVLGSCRIRTAHQDQRSLAYQEPLLRRFLRELYDGPAQWKSLTLRGSGKCLARKELARAGELIESHNLDLVLAEDHVRLCRRGNAYEIARRRGIAADASSPSIAPSRVR